MGEKKMKKMLAIAAIVMLVPFTAFGLEMMADTALEDVTGQAGVSISIDNVQMDMSIDYVAWGDDDGFNDAYGTNDGWVNINTIKMTGIIIDSWTGSSNLEAIDGNVYIYNTTTEEFDKTVISAANSNLKFLTIDVGEYPTLTVGLDTAVRIGVPTLQIYVDKISDIDITLAATAGAEVLTGDTLGTISMGSIQLDTKAGYVYILAH
jgi:hypothetical protein